MDISQKSMAIKSLQTPSKSRKRTQGSISNLDPFRHFQGGARTKFACLETLLEIRVATTHKAVDLAGVRVVKNEHHDKHEQSVKDIDEYLMFHEESLVSLDVLDHTNDRSDQDEDTGNIKGIHVPIPYALQLFRTSRWISSDSHLEQASGDDEKAEEDDLHEETADDNVFAGAHAALACDHKSRTFSIIIIVWKLK